LSRWVDSAPELRDLDAAVGDGDLGVTVTRGVTAIRAALTDLSTDDLSVSVVCQAVGAAFAKGSPSTFSALLGGGLMHAAKAAESTSAFDRSSAALVLEEVTETVKKRGRVKVGDKTVLDGLAASREAFQADVNQSAHRCLEDMASAAELSVIATSGLVAQRGRAAWLQARTAGHPDPGATAYARLLRALAECFPKG
jgi:dihydroxyacetone kinase-like protein